MNILALTLLTVCLNRTEFNMIAAEPVVIATVKPSEIKSLIKKIEKQVAKPPTKRVETVKPSKSWYSNYSITVNGYTYNGLNIYGYPDPQGSNRIVFEKNDQTPEVQRLLTQPQSIHYYMGVTCVNGQCGR